jgi:chromosome segregation protein
MKIKEIKLYGFKSFRAETRVLLNKGVTAFVGPNGSGKSNIFDALRWVFGEQSMKALRCERIEDLIYVSSDSKEDANFTDVSVIIENEEYFPQFGSEFEIKRRFYRTGESEFFLNRVKCRLQDIQALFLNSGALTYSFLELAEVERIIHGDTKEMFDDVAGILKYQERKEQTKRRLVATEQDLLRLEDIIVEMQRGLRGLKRQVRQARLYNELRAEYKSLMLFIMAKEFLATQQEIKDIQSQIDAKEAERQKVMHVLQQLGSEREDLRKAIENAENERASSVVQIKQIGETIEGLEKQIREKEEDVRNRTILSEKALTRIKEKQDAMDNDKRRLAELEDERKEVLAKLDRRRRDADAQRAECDAQEAKYFTIESTLKDNDKAMSSATDQINNIQNELAKLKYDMENKEKLVSQTKAELLTLNVEVEEKQRMKLALEQDVDKMIKEQNEEDTYLKHIREKADELKKRIDEVDNDIKSRNEAIVDCRIMLDALSRRLQTDGRKEIEKKFGHKVAGMFRDGIEVDSGYEAIVDICLSDLLDFYLLKDYDSSDFTDSPEGRFGFIDMNEQWDAKKPPEIDDALPLSRFIKFKSAANILLKYVLHYFLVGDYDRARDLSRHYREFGFVTRDGLLCRNGMIVVERGDVGFFKIRQSLEEYKEKMSALNNEVLFSTEEKTRLDRELQDCEAEIEEARNRLFAINMKKSECSLKLQDAEKLVEKQGIELNNIKEDREALLEDVKRIAGETVALEQEIVQIKDLQAHRDGQKEELTALMNSMTQEMNQANTKMNSMTTEIAVLEDRANTIEKSIQALKAEIADGQSEIQKLKEESLSDTVAQLNELIGSLKQELAIKQQERSTREAKLPAQLMEEYNKRQGLVFDQLAQKQKEHEGLQDQVMQLKYQLFEKNHRRDDLTRKADEEFGVALIDHVPEEDIPDAHEKITEVKGRIEKLGQINPLSLEVYEEEKKRLDEFLGQRDDIIAAKKNLLKSIEELDQRARDRFNETFKDVREQFNFVFANFFKDGQADLILTDPDNPLSSKVEIVVRMMGRRLKTINQLSGGQKTLLAISLLLAFYLVKPAPFCILDEIDAPLDDINVVRFNKFLRDLSQRTQVVIITHNRATMEYADYLYGLTMEKPRESRVISARLADLEKIPTLEE